MLNGAGAGIAGQHSVEWLLRGNETPKTWFTDRATGWNTTGYYEVVSQNLDAIVVTPI